MNFRFKFKLNILPILGLIFVTLKLCHVLDWSWWWVTAPFWVEGILVVLEELTKA